MTEASQKRGAYLFLVIAIAVSSVFAFPHEQRAHALEPVSTEYWVVNSCGTVLFRLLAGTFVQAILVPLILFLLPGPGSISSTWAGRSPRFQLALIGQNASGKWYAWPFMLIGLGWLFAAAISIGWWCCLLQYAQNHWQCTELFDLSPQATRVGYVSEYSRYFIYLSTFSGFWSGIAAGVLRMQSARAAVADASSADPRQFQAFFWVCFLGWAVQYRISQGFTRILSPHYQGWISWVPLYFVFVIASSLCVFTIVRFLWNRKPQSWLWAVIQAFLCTFLIYLLTAAAFWWMLVYISIPLAPLVQMWNAFGLVWALLVGTLRWRTLRNRRATAPREVAV